MKGSITSPTWGYVKQKCCKQEQKSDLCGFLSVFFYSLSTDFFYTPRKMWEKNKLSISSKRSLILFLPFSLFKGFFECVCLYWFYFYTHTYVIFISQGCPYAEI